MIDKLRFAIDNTDSPKLLALLSKIAALTDEEQELTLNLVEMGIYK